MKLSFKNNFLGYFSFYYRIIGNSFFAYLSLSVLVSILDGLGLAMFVPLLQLVSDGNATNSAAQSLGQFKYIVNFIQLLGFGLTVNSILAMVCILFLIKGLLKYIHLSFNAGIRYKLIKKVRFELLNNLQNLSFPAFVKLDAGKIQNTLTTEVTRLFQTMSYYFSAAQSSAMLITYIVLAFLANYQFAVLVTIGSLVSNIIYKRIYRTLKKTSAEISKKGSDFNGFLIQAVHYFKYLKATNTFSSYATKLRNVIVETESLNRHTGKLKALGLSIKEPVIVVIVSLVILIQVNFIGTNLSTIVLSLVLFYRALSFLVSVQTDYQSFIEQIGAMDSIAALSDEMAKLKENKGTEDFKVLTTGITFCDVAFNYGSKQALSQINLSVPVKQTIALIGESGSGKTTIANMIAGLIKPNSGKVMIDNVSLEDISMGVYRDKIGYISQEPVVFNDSIYNNVTFWAPSTRENLLRFEKALKMASLQQFVKSLPEKEHTKLGNNGILISGGQKQRISIARELFKEAEILIFDEATSALDSETERIIQENIQQLQGSFTMILIAHRLSTVKKADIIYLVENGRITASGSFEQMIESSTRFKKMVSLQMV
ncbi:ABC transporter ATP-binding protein [Ilyomonas limi]|uniref:ABC transporter ATP-binding protein n=1 Tax=Ilyomonas limi TaxID=2575867 RepID=A0A4U3KRZ4_9BACT|nr:ABC transporter ATP-binding protein [Ilyomonas limi]TKK65031.1 ABC transporter ATP-binding protein [Ilyomonas limi]